MVFIRCGDRIFALELRSAIDGYRSDRVALDIAFGLVSIENIIGGEMDDRKGQLGSCGSDGS
jgi:hypothetical protein